MSTGSPEYQPTSAAPDVAALVRAAAVEHPDRLAVVEAGGRAMGWHDLDHEVDQIATALGHLGVRGGHRVVLMTANRIEFVTTYLGILRAQAVAVPVNPLSTVEEVGRILADATPRVVVGDEVGLPALREAVADQPGPVVVAVGAAPLTDETPYVDLLVDRVRSVPPLPDPEKLAVLLYTSGASGRPRAAMLTHRALLANVDQVASAEPPMIGSDDVVLGVLPLFHVYGLGAVLGGVIRHRAKLVLTDRFDPEGTLDLIEDEACSVVPVAPPVFAAWRGREGVAERLGPVRLILSGSAPLAAETVEEFADLTGVPVHQGYGMTEAAPVVTSTLRSRQPKAGSVGAALAGIDLRLVDEDGSPLAGASADDPGEIQIRGDNLFSGYWPDGVDGPDPDGWWSTGDVGFLDDDGDLFLVDRVTDLVIVSGFNVYPTEVEAVIHEVPGVRLVAVVGAPDPDTGEAVVAHVVPAGELAADQADQADQADRADQLASAVAAACEERLAPYKRPTRVEVVGTLPRTVTGKVRKGILRGAERRRALGLLD